MLAAKQSAEENVPSVRRALALPVLLDRHLAQISFCWKNSFRPFELSWAVATLDIRRSRRMMGRLNILFHA
jgi:hypothetical protein